MKYLLNLLFLMAFAMPFSSVSASPYDDATMEVMEHSDAAKYDHDIDIPEDKDDDHDKDHAKEEKHEKHDMDDDKDDDKDEKEDSDDEKDSASDDDQDERGHSSDS